MHLQLSAAPFPVMLHAKYKVTSETITFAIIRNKGKPHILFYCYYFYFCIFLTLVFNSKHTKAWKHAFQSSLGHSGCLRYKLKVQKKALSGWKKLLSRNRTRKTKKYANRAYMLMEDTRAPCKQATWIHFSMYFSTYVKQVFLFFFPLCKITEIVF